MTNSNETTSSGTHVYRMVAASLMAVMLSLGVLQLTGVIRL